MTKQITKRRPDPFDGSAPARLTRMGLLTQAGEVDAAAMDAFIHISAGSFFDELCDEYGDREQLGQIMAAFRDFEERRDPQRILLLISLQYDNLRKPLPDPIWWLAGHPSALALFSLGFTTYLLQLMEDMKNTEKEDDPSETVDCGTQ